MTGLFAAVLASAGVALFPNGDFEKGAAGWKLPDKLWSVVDGAGVRGSKAIVVDIPPGSNLNYVVSEMFPVEPGTVYRFEVSEKNDSFKCRYGRIGASFEALDANFREVGGCGGTLQDDNEVGRDGWCRYAGKSRPLPKTAVWGRFAIWAPAHGCVGRIRYDDFKLEQVASKPGVKAVHTSAYRDTAVRGKLRLAAEYFANPTRYPDADLRGAFVFSGNGKTLRVPAERLGDESAEATASLDALPVGDYQLSFVVETKDGETLGEKTIPFHLVSELPRRKVAIDEHHRTLVDGRPFFPLGMYWARINEPQLQVYTNGPFNCLMAYKSPTREEMDLAWKYGLRVIYASQGLYAAFVGKPEKKREYLDRRLALKDHPALLAWYVCDELRAELVPELVERNLAFRAADPDHPTWQVLNYPDRAREFLDGADAVGCDPYPVSGHHDGTSAPISIASSSPEKVARGTYGMRPMWTVPQMFNWGWYRKEIYDKPIVRMPTRDEMANMAWQAVAAGSNGLVFYSFMDVMDKEKDAKKREAYWQDMLSVVREVKKWERVLLSEPSDLTVAGVPADKLVVRAWKCQGEDVALVVSRKESEPVKADLTFSNGKKVSVDLKPLGCRFLRLGKSDVAGAAVSCDVAQGKVAQTVAKDPMSAEYRKLWGPSVQAEIDARIERHRKADAVVAGFKPGTAVEVEQLTHDFRFGAHIFNFDQLGSREANDTYKATFTNLLNAATVAYYWSSYEPVKGRFRHAAGPHDSAAFWNGVAALSPEEKYDRYVEYRRPAPDPILDFCAANGIDAHGHAMIYRVSQPDWVTNAAPTDAEQIELYRTHVRELASHVGTRVSQWDVVNESVRRDAPVDAPDDTVFWGNATARPVPAGYTLACYDEAAKCLPKGVGAAINEACVIDDVYIAFVKSLLDRGAKIDIVGLQFHIFNAGEMIGLAKGAHKGRRGYSYTPARIMETLKKADRLGRPIHISEITVPAPEETPWGEAVQAEALRDLYRLWFSWPSVYRITYWNLVDFTYHKESLASGFYGRDMRKKAVYHVLDRLINHDWKTRLSLKASPDGSVSFRGFCGTYRVRGIGADGQPCEKTAQVAVPGL